MVKRVVLSRSHDLEIPREKDIEFPEDDLKEIATTIWLAQGFDV